MDKLDYDEMKLLKSDADYILPVIDAIAEDLIAGPQSKDLVDRFYASVMQVAVRHMDPEQIESFLQHTVEEAAECLTDDQIEKVGHFMDSLRTRLSMYAQGSH